MSYAKELEEALHEEMGFDGPVKKPTPDTEKELRDALKAYVLDNDKGAIVQRIDGVKHLLSKGQYERLLSVGKHGWAYRFVDTTTPKALAKILDKKLAKKGSLGGGIIKPDHRGLSSWTINPRSLVYSGYFSVIPKGSHLALLKAPVGGENTFFGNPDELARELKLDNGYALEREVIGVGPISYTEGVYVLRDPKRSIEGQAMDLINDLVPLETLKGKWSDAYYFPKLGSK